MQLPILNAGILVYSVCSLSENKSSNLKEGQVLVN